MRTILLSLASLALAAPVLAQATPPDVDGPVKVFDSRLLLSEISDRLPDLPPAGFVAADDELVSAGVVKAANRPPDTTLPPPCDPPVSNTPAAAKPPAPAPCPAAPR